MDASAWIALVGLAFAMVIQLAVTAFVMGGLFQRVKDLENNAPDIAALIRGLAKLESAMDHLTKQFDANLGWLTRVENYETKAPNARTRRKP